MTKFKEMNWKEKTSKLKDKIKEQTKEVQTILNPKDPKQGLTVHNESISVYWNKTKKLVSLEKREYDLGYGYINSNGKRKRVQTYGKELVGTIVPQKANGEENRLVFEWIVKDVKYKVTIGDTVNPHHEKTKGFDCFITIQNKNKTRYFKTISFHKEDRYTGHEFRKLGIAILSFLCYEVFAENNFEEVCPPKLTQAVISQYLYDKGSVFECPKCNGKQVIRACGRTRLSVYKIPPRELCSCYFSSNPKDFVIKEELLKTKCKVCEQGFVTKDFEERNFFPLFAMRRGVKWDTEKVDKLNEMLFMSASWMGNKPTKEEAKVTIPLRFSHEYCPCWDKDDGND